MKADRLKARAAKRAARESSISLIDWMLKYRHLLTPDRAFDLERHPYLRALYTETAQRVVVNKAAQVGVSEYMISYVLHAADQRHATGLYVFPTDSHVSDFSSARIGPAIEASAHLSGVVVDGVASDGRRGADRVTLKRIGDRFLYLRGAKVDPDGHAPQLKSIDADVLVLDEIDEMDVRAPTIARKRLGHSALAEERQASTPTYAGYGIHAAWLMSDQRQWHIRCEHCGQWQALTIGHVVVEWDQLERPVAWHGQGEGRAWAACGKCGKELDRLSVGRWIPAYSDRDVAGYHITKLFSPTVELIDIVKALNTVDETQRKEAFNQDLTEPYTPRGGQLTDEILDRCRRDYAHGRTRDERTVMGIDVGRVLHVVIRGPAHIETGEKPQRWAGEMTWDDLDRLLADFSVRKVVIDALPETAKAREFQARHPGIVWLAYYPNQPVGSKRENLAQWDANEKVVNIDRTRSLDALFADFSDEKITLPANVHDVRDYYAHLKAPVRVIEDAAGGQQVARYVENGPDHFAHAENYCRIAGETTPPASATNTGPRQIHASRPRSSWQRG